MNKFRNPLAMSNWFIFSMPVAKALGLNEAVLLGYLSNRAQYFEEVNQLDDNGFFYCTHESIEEGTTLSKYQQVTAMGNLEKHGVLKVEKRGMPRRNYYRIDPAPVVKFFDYKQSKNLTACSQETSPLLNNNRDNKQTIRTESGSLRDPVRKLQRRKPSEIIRADKSALQPKKKVKAVKKVAVPSKVKCVLRYWESKGLYLPKDNTSTFRLGVERIKALFEGNAFAATEYEQFRKRRFTIREIRRSIDRFALAALDPHHFPVTMYKKHLRTMSITNFIYSPFSQNGQGKSQFLYYLKNEPKPTGVPVSKMEDDHPEITTALKKRYIAEVLGGVAPKFSIREENSFILAGEKLYEFIKKYRSRINWYQSFTPSLLATWVFEALRAELDGNMSKVTPAWIASDQMYNRRLLAYLHNQAMLAEAPLRQTRVGFLHA